MRKAGRFRISTNLKYMKRWYLFYNDQDEIGHQAGDEIQKQVLTIRHQAGDELGMPTIFGRVPSPCYQHYTFLAGTGQGLCIRWPSDGAAHG